jgi:hypothetical protein
MPASQDFIVYAGDLDEDETIENMRARFREQPRALRAARIAA